ncbi:putative myb and hsa domain protein [Phaeoacremonium minimum UCRPA7]|uniref:Vacuolar import and degradation protein 21 n=1 Tax=Phaeoacremonium minimum (strain UCR-PA7) TaxID=1286976 RepID=R8BTV3_PHAM7|nr:putative myb and hsa domain protein [Phaeoacremonium minimum UCRPA7]EOO02802.1 putative myb and hsa domain protein [Phaeoacremonium minimum UCRPA7]
MQRKLRELYHVATEPNGLPNFDFTNPDAPPTTPGENQFLVDSDILQGRNLNESKIPPRPKLNLETLKQYIAGSRSVPDENAPIASSKQSQDAVKASLKTETNSTNGPADVLRVLDHAVQTRHSPAPPVDANEGQILTEDVSKAASTKAHKTQPPESLSSTLTPAATDIPAEGGDLEVGKTGIESTSKSSTTSQKRIGKDGRTLPARDGDERQKKRQADAKHPAQQSLVPESMDVDEKTELVGADNGSTTQTATTPAIHDVSTDTSPDNEDSQYNEDENAGVEPEKPDGNQALPEAQDIDMKDAGDLPDPTSLQEANAQLLKESQANKSEENAVVPSRDQGGSLPSDDYFTTLFVDGFTRQSKWMKSIEVILGQAHKTVSTDDCAISLLENQACKVLRRVYHLQQNDKWSLRQPKRCPEPTRPSSHWDVLLQEMKWMRTDFREERKWKRAVARNLADACAEWVASDPEQRKALQVKALIPSPIKGDTSQDPAPDSAKDAEIDFLPTPVPDLVHTGDAESPMDVDEEINDWPVDTIAPSAIFALQDDEVIFGLRKSTMSDQLLDELPMYGAPLKAPKFDLTGSDSDPDAHWRRPALPLSKYVEGQMVISSSGPPCKRSRYRYEEEEESSGDRVLFDNEPADLSKAGPENKDVALFNPDMKPIRDRLHAGHQFRPPTEFNMPLQSFYESRMASQWTWAEDDELKALVREYSYNWSLISSMISTKSCFASGAERRTPWECFERWVQLEGLPNDMSKTQYFQTYQKRIDAAQRVIMQQSQAAQQQVGPNGAVTPVPRRRPTTTVRVERRRNQKHLALIDAMRKLAKKRETTIQKQQHAASLAAMRKANEVQQQRGPNKTPRDYSLMRWERDQQLAEKMAQYAQRQQEVHRRVRQLAKILKVSSSERS